MLDHSLLVIVFDGRKTNLEYQQTYPLSAFFSLYAVSSSVCQQVNWWQMCCIGHIMGTLLFNTKITDLAGTTQFQNMVG